MKLKIVRRSVLKQALDSLRSEGRTIVFTDGFFDVLHIGHLRYLREARSLGDCLVVGLNTDDSIRELKGGKPPIVPEFERAEMLAGLESVDYIVLFSEARSDRIIRELCPDVYAKWGDYMSLQKIPEAATVKEVGGRTAIIPKMEGKSTDQLISHVKKTSKGDREDMSEEGVVGIIPARLASTRLPNKPLLDIAGKPMIHWVYERANSASRLDKVIVATPDDEILQTVESFGGKAVMTSPNHRSGTDRIAEAAENLNADIIVNIQGDEPTLDPGAVDLLVEAMQASPEVQMGSLMCALSKQEEDDPSAVKVVTDRQGFALYFSRARIPYPRQANASAKKHVGIYAYRRSFLIAFSSMAPSPLEITESLEQLRALENGYEIKMIETLFSPTSVDTPEDLERVRAILTSE